VATVCHLYSSRSILVRYTTRTVLVDLDADKGRRQALDAIKSIQDSGARRSDTENLTRIIVGLASDSSRQRPEELIMAISYRSEFIDSWKDKGRAEGQAEVKAKDILKVLDSRKVRLTKTQRETIAASTDLSLLDTWFDRALVTTTAADVLHS
jgi:superfamily I DNA/RNA helicase